MFNFTDEWSVQEYAMSRQAKFLDEVQRRRIAKELARERQPGNKLRRRLGVGMMRLGERLIGVGR